MMELGFRHEGLDGQVVVEVRPNTDPAALGCPDCARGFPVCRATVSHPARGYAAAFGWIQLTRFEGSDDGFALDPFAPLGSPAHPFGFVGFEPVLFDAPYWDSRADLHWTVHSFLATLGGLREAYLLAGFSWGLSIRGGEIEVVEAQPLLPAAWDEHLPYLEREFPDWSFAPGGAPSPRRLDRPFSEDE